MQPMAVDQADRPPRSQWLDVWDQFKTHKGALRSTQRFFEAS
jgi:peptide/nickel transport system permease protein